MAVWIALAVFGGGTLVVLGLALCTAAKRGDEQLEREAERSRAERRREWRETWRNN